MKRVTIFLILFSLLFGSSISKKIKQQQRELRLKQKQYDRMDRKLAQIAKEIIDIRTKNRILTKKLHRLERKIKKTQSIYDALSKKIRD